MSRNLPYRIMMIVEEITNIVDKELREIGALFIKSSCVNLAS